MNTAKIYPSYQTYWSIGKNYIHLHISFEFYVATYYKDYLFEKILNSKEEKLKSLVLMKPSFCGERTILGEYNYIVFNNYFNLCN